MDKMTLDHVTRDFRAYAADGGASLSQGDLLLIADAIDAEIKSRGSHSLPKIDDAMVSNLAWWLAQRDGEDAGLHFYADSAREMLEAALKDIP